MTELKTLKWRGREAMKGQLGLGEQKVPWLPPSCSDFCMLLQPLKKEKKKHNKLTILSPQIKHPPYLRRMPRETESAHALGV